jgi:hypothetical protein
VEFPTHNEKSKPMVCLGKGLGCENQASLRITFKRKRTIPITSKTWIMPPAWYPKNPIAQLMIKITAMM